MNRNTGGLVDHQHLVVLEHNGRLHDALNPGTWRHLLGFFLAGNRRYAHLITGIHAGIRLHTPLVNPNLALADNSINNALWHTTQLGKKKVIHPLTIVILIHVNPLNALTNFASGSSIPTANLTCPDRLIGPGPGWLFAG